MPRSACVGVIHVAKRLASSSCCSAKLSACDLINISDKCVAHNYCALPVVLDKGKVCVVQERFYFFPLRNDGKIRSEHYAKSAPAHLLLNRRRAQRTLFAEFMKAYGVSGSFLYDINGKEYLDFLSGYAAVSIGHCHSKICRVITEQVKQLTHTSRAFYTKALAEYGEYITGLFSYDKVLPMNSGNEASETAVKLARKWGYRIKGICPNQAKVLFAENNFWGRSIAAVSASTDPNSYRNYGPFVPCFDTVPFSDVDALEWKLRDPNVCAFMVEPIQGEAGVIIPEPCYLKQVRELCTRNKVLFIADEVQCGLGRAGSLLCCDIYRVRPDVLILGKALSGGFMPISAVLADADIMDVIEPGTHGSTFGGNPLSCRVAVAVLKTLQEEHLAENARAMGEILRESLCDLPKDIICEIRGVGLLNAIVLREGINTWELCLDMMNHGLLVRTAREQIIRLCPPLSIKPKEILKATKIIRHCIENSRGSCNSGGNFLPPSKPLPLPKPKSKLKKFLGSKTLNNPFKSINKICCFDS